ncbi:hypothetical protein [Arthrobacter sp. VKM Ac-2550]|uniref:hypothetical protein n=1 Tax=Crystallibacter permensis TaxID=1938888 RepID=UPI002225FDFE|nr:hypothetical protein [Arthrobacter sp. VKM Ac-2550]
MTALIGKRNKDALDALRRDLFNESNLLSPANPYETFRPSGTGQLRSVTDRHTDLSIGADQGELAYVEEQPGLEGYRITVSMAGSNRIMGGRTALPTAETDAWLYALLGEDLARFAYHAGALSGPASGLRPSTVYYFLFLDSGRKPMPRPAGSEDVVMAPVDPTAFS